MKCTNGSENSPTGRTGDSCNWVRIGGEEEGGGGQVRRKEGKRDGVGGKGKETKKIRKCELHLLICF